MIAYLVGCAGTLYLAAGYLVVSTQFWVEVLLIPSLQALVLTLLGGILRTRGLVRRTLELVRFQPVLGVFPLVDIAALAGLFWLDRADRLSALSLYFGLRCLSLAAFAALILPRLQDRAVRMIFAGIALSSFLFGLKPLTRGWGSSALEMAASVLLVAVLVATFAGWLRRGRQGILWPACLILLWLPLGLIRGLSWWSPKPIIYPWLWSSLSLVLGLLLLTAVGLTAAEIARADRRGWASEPHENGGPRRVLSDTRTECLTQIWLVLFVVNLLGDLITGILGFQLADLRFEAFAQRLVVPWIQALAIALLFQRDRRIYALRTLPELLRKQPFLALFFLADTIFLVSSWLRGTAFPMAVSEAWARANLYNGVKAVLAGSLLFSLVLKGRLEGRRAALWISILGLGAAGYGSTHFLNWLGLLPDYLFPGLSQLYRQQLVYGPLFFASLAVVWKVERICRPLSGVGAGMLELVAVFALISANVVILGVYNRPQLPPFWDQVVRTGGFLAIAALWVTACRLTEDTRKKGTF